VSDEVPGEVSADLSARDASDASAPTSVSDLERILMMTDRILVLENKLAELRHRYASLLRSQSEQEVIIDDEDKSDLERQYPRLARVYTRVLRIPGVGRIAHIVVARIKGVESVSTEHEPQ